MSVIPHEVKWNSERSQRLWNYYGSNPNMESQFFGHLSGRFVAEMLFAKIRLSQGARLLDFSCGNGDVIAACLPHMDHAQEIYATDVSANFVQRVTERFAQQRRFKGAQLTTSLPSSFAEGMFDVVIATEVIEHLFDHELDEVLSECRRLLRPGGHVFLTTPNNEDYEANKTICPECGCIFHRWQHLRTWTADSLRTRIEIAGFETDLVAAVAWASRRTKLWMALRRRPLAKTGLVYIGTPRAAVA